MRIQLVWAPDREDHVARHGVGRDEVEEVVASDPYVTNAGHARYRVIGQTDYGRYLTIIIGRRSSTLFGVITARDSGDRERRDYWRRRRRR